MDESSQQLPWFKEGLRFQCTECGKCCTGAPGYVWVTENEMEEIARFLHLSLEVFQKKYIRMIENRYALIEKRIDTHNYDCTFLEDKKCRIYSHRPTQCRTYPWWKQTLDSKAAWKAESRNCEGINEEAPLIPYSHIQNLLQTNNQ